MYWSLLNMYSENFRFGLGGFYYWGDLFKSGEVIKLNKPHSQIRNSNEQGATWTLKWKGGPQHYADRNGMLFVGGRGRLVATLRTKT